jgi:DNA-binding response OmpR family regulator
MRILLVEDDRETAHYIARGLEEEGNTVSVCWDGAAGLRSAQLSPFDAMVLDIMLPSLDGVEVTRRIRAENITTPILLLTARDTVTDIVKGLDAGADDYLTKPFSFDVLLARLRARTRVNQAGAQSTLRFADLTIDRETREAWRAAEPLSLTRTEFAILELLVQSAGRVVTRQRIIDTVWGGDHEVGNNNLDVFIRLLRMKVDEPHGRHLIRTVRGIGYCLREEK